MYIGSFKHNFYLPLVEFSWHLQIWCKSCQLFLLLRSLYLVQRTSGLLILAAFGLFGFLLDHVRGSPLFCFLEISLVSAHTHLLYLGKRTFS